MRGFPSISPFLGPTRRRGGPPNKSDIIRWFTIRDEYTLLDKLGNDATLLPISTSISATSIFEFTDLTGVTITSYEGDQMLSISGNNIISSGVGDAHSLLLSNGSFYPVLHLKTDVINGNDIVSVTDANQTYSLTGSLHMQDVGAVARKNNISVFNGVSDYVRYDGVYYYDYSNLVILRGVITINEDVLNDFPVKIGNSLVNYISTIRLMGNRSFQLYSNNATVSIPNLFTLGETFKFEIRISIADKTISVFKNDLLFIEFTNVDLTYTLYDPTYMRIGLSNNLYLSDFSLIGNGEYAISIPLPHTAIGYDSNKNRIALTVSGGVSGSYDENGTTDFEDLTFDETGGNYIPNKPNGQPAYPLAEGDTFISGSLGRMNITPSYVRLYELGDVDLVKTFFDKSNDLIWKQTVRDSVYYDSSNTGDWHNSELTQQCIYDNIQDAYKYQLWSKIQSGVFKDIFLYGLPLEGDNICKAKKYVGVGETYATIEDAVEFCDNDNLE